MVHYPLRDSLWNPPPWARVNSSPQDTCSASQEAGNLRRQMRQKSSRRQRQLLPRRQCGPPPLSSKSTHRNHPKNFHSTFLSLGGTGTVRRARGKTVNRLLCPRQWIHRHLSWRVRPQGSPRLSSTLSEAERGRIQGRGIPRLIPGPMPILERRSIMVCPRGLSGYSTRLRSDQLDGKILSASSQDQRRSRHRPRRQRELPSGTHRSVLLPSTTSQPIRVRHPGASRFFFHSFWSYRSKNFGRNINMSPFQGVKRKKSFGFKSKSAETKQPFVPGHSAPQMEIYAPKNRASASAVNPNASPIQPVKRKKSFVFKSTSTEIRPPSGLIAPAPPGGSSARRPPKMDIYVPKGRASGAVSKLNPTPTQAVKRKTSQEFKLPSTEARAFESVPSAAFNSFAPPKMGEAGDLVPAIVQKSEDYPMQTLNPKLRMSAAAQPSQTAVPLNPFGSPKRKPVSAGPTDPEIPVIKSAQALKYDKAPEPQ
ncbi:hypothetical protein C8F04DRAFT_133978 [Mycena alexandri]|uniref:Uncharacterized protein n=1 Tax=Mycena alexandri TaxID=1745969 RepID=A0AAD6WSL3_9AGAR|nr:hypothetical protein C8F04DRAFT_133978 [Mycena alexandri]